MKILLVARSKDFLKKVAHFLEGYHYETVVIMSDDEAVAQLQTGSISGMVIGGGVDQESEERLRSVASENDVWVVKGALGDKDIETYVRDELVFALNQAAGR